MGENTKPVWADWFKAVADSTYIPDNFGVSRERADEIRNAIGKAMKKIATDDSIPGNMETLCLLSAETANIQTPGEFDLLSFYLGQFHMLDHKSDEGVDEKVKALTAVLVEMGKLLSRLSNPSGDLETIKQMVGGNMPGKVIKVAPGKAKAVMEMLDQMDKFASDEGDDVDALLLLKEATGKKPDSVN